MADSSSDTSGVGCGGLGMMLAVVLSWSANHSIGWAFVHGLLGWFYVIARVVGCADGGSS